MVLTRVFAFLHLSYTSVHLSSVLHRLRAAPAASDKAASFPARPWTAAVRESGWHPLGMLLPAVRGAKHSCATTAEVKILHWGTAQLEMPTPGVGKGIKHNRCGLWLLIDETFEI